MVQSLTTSFLSEMSQSLSSRMQRNVASGSSNSQKPNAAPNQHNNNKFIIIINNNNTTTKVYSDSIMT